MSYVFRHPARLHRVIDADTIDFEVDLGYHITKRIRVRLMSVDAPEIRGAERPIGLIAKQFVEDILSKAEQLEVFTIKKGKYGRWIGDARFKSDTKHVATGIYPQTLLTKELVKAGLATYIDV